MCLFFRSTESKNNRWAAFVPPAGATSADNEVDSAAGSDDDDGVSGLPQEQLGKNGSSGKSSEV